tara:strand:+ start:198 stop:1247 length:1050 start_codon:yes stop_codon:yes gene_type:complete
MKYPSYKVAAAHVAPIFLNGRATVDKACALIEEAARHGAQLIVFPETYIPAFPLWCSLQAPIYNHQLFYQLASNSVRADGPEIKKILDIARRKRIFISLGFNESSPVSVGCIWNANLLINDQGNILCHHRKLVPTYYEKLVWASGDGRGLQVCETRLGRLGMLICGENTNPLARFTLLAQGEQVHLSTYPPMWPTHDPSTGANYDLKQAIQIRAGAHSFEGKVFNIVASGFLDKTARDRLAQLTPEAGRIIDGSPRGISVVIGPEGKPISKIMQDSEGLLYADIDLSCSVIPKQIHDVVGGYNRFDIFNLSVDRSPRNPVTFEVPANSSESMQTDTINEGNFDAFKSRE